MLYDASFLQTLKSLNSDIEDIEDYPIDEYTTYEVECLQVHLMAEAIAYAISLVPLIAEDIYFGPIQHGFFYSDREGSKWMPGVDEEEAAVKILSSHPLLD